MQRYRQIFAAAVTAATMAATNSAAEARHYRHAEVYSDDVCGPISPSTTLYIYPAANWEPFFRRHLYRYGPILACLPSSRTGGVISVRY
jgi:hypothetical protein